MSGTVSTTETRMASRTVITMMSRGRLTIEGEVPEQRRSKVKQEAETNADVCNLLHPGFGWSERQQPFNETTFLFWGFQRGEQYFLFLKDSLGGLFRIVQEAGVGGGQCSDTCGRHAGSVGSEPGGKGPGCRCSVLDCIAGSYGTGSTAVYWAPAISSTCCDHINTR
ncbi:hypothetical protein GOODEAATRI_000106 [Goodea atripinnis]|uniref:Uncharacterized protein n=1 Tax=Goodea atripinnis TaxID=208336 RepID=A0ABV0P043_9TELE